VFANNFEQVLATIKLARAVKQGILEVGLSWSELLNIRYAFLSPHSMHLDSVHSKETMPVITNLWRN